MISDLSRPLTLLIGAIALVGCTSAPSSPSTKPGVELPQQWAGQSTVFAQEGTISARVVARRAGDGVRFKLRISVLPGHENDVFFLAPTTVPDGEVPRMLCMGGGRVVETQLGAPGLAEEGLEKLTLLRAGQGFSRDFFLDCGEKRKVAMSIRVTLFFIFDRVQFFRREFAKLRDLGARWDTEVGSPIYCDYMRSLVPVEVSIPLAGGPGPCEYAEGAKF